MIFYRNIANSNIDPNFGNVSLLLKGTGTATTSGPVTTGTILDDSGNNTISVLADVVLSPVIKKFGDYSIKFDGSGDRLQIPDDARFDLSSGAFTIEAWFYCNAIDGNYQAIVSKDTFGSNFSWSIQINSTSVRTATNNISGDWEFTSNVTIIAKTWHHVSLVGDGTNMYHYFNGVLIGTKNRTLTNASSNITVGCVSWNNPGQFFNGYIDDLRITKGGNTSLLLSGTGTRIEKTILDSSGNNHPISIFGDSFLSSVVKKYGDYSISFDGSGDRLTIYDDPTFNLSGVPFTVEMWFYCNSINSNLQTLVTKHTFGVNLSWNITINNASISTYSNNNGNTPILNSNVVITAGIWHHIALVGNGTNIKHYFNGVEVGSVNGILSNAASLITIGADSWNNPVNSVNGYIDDLRITKGLARYTSNFTPPTKELPSNFFI